MSTTKRKSTAAAKRKRAMPAKRKSMAAAKPERVVRGYGAALEGRVGRFWTIQVKPKETAHIAQTLPPCRLVIQNHGPGNVKLFAQRGDSMDLPPGNLRATYVSGEMTVESTDNKSALIELELFPVLLKY
jgi:hypothetical protein